VRESSDISAWSETHTIDNDRSATGGVLSPWWRAEETDQFAILLMTETSPPFVDATVSRPSNEGLCDSDLGGIPGGAKVGFQRAHGGLRRFGALVWAGPPNAWPSHRGGVTFGVCVSLGIVERFKEKKKNN